MCVCLHVFFPCQEILQFSANTDFMSYNLIQFLGGSKNTADGDCSHEIKRRLLLGRKAMTN